MSKWAWCLVNDDNTLAIGWNKIGDYWYYFYSNGQMACDEWLKINDIFYKINDKGQMLTGWWQDSNNGEWYYLIEESDPSKAEYKGQMLSDCTRNINGKEYTFSKDGSMIEDSSLLSDAGTEFIGSWEGLYLKAYEDPYYKGNQNYWTIGYGTTYEVKPEAFPDGLNSTCIKEQALEWLKDESKNCAETIKSDLDSKGISLSQNELDGLISFAYNCGVSALLGSTLYKNIVNGVKDSNTIIANFQAWSKTNGIASTGLLKRRNSEADLFLNANYTGNV